MQALILVGCDLVVLPEAVRHSCQLLRLDLKANHRLQHMSSGCYLNHLRELTLARCAFKQ